MLRVFTLIVFLLGCPANAETLELVRKLPHSGYSEGLDHHKNLLWHALPKKLLKISPKDGTVLKTFAPATKYSESLTWFQGKLWNVSYSDNGIYRGELQGDKFNFVRVGTTPEKHAWGITHNGKHLILTGNYSPKIYFWDPVTRKVVRHITTPIADVEDLAWDGVGLWSSSFTKHKGMIFRIDPKNGSVSGLFSIPDPLSCPVIDGIAYNKGKLYITGKHCPSIWVVKKPTERQISSSQIARKEK